MPRSAEPRRRSPVVWLLTDSKPGHRNQLKGLGNRLRVLIGADLHWVEADKVKVPLWRALLGASPRLDVQLPPPDLIVAAGSGTHRLLLSLRRRRRAKTLVLMKPGFPLAWVDGVVAPIHDDVHGANVLRTEGALNAITPLARLTYKPEALILIGGPSPHFHWDDDVVLGQIGHLIGHYAKWRWTISSSRRTPASLSARLAELANPKVSVVAPQDTHESWLAHQLAASRAAWITPDSLSMVCEAATSGVPTGIFELSPKPGSRVSRGITALAERGHIAHWSEHAAVMAGDRVHSEPLWEADRTARWVIDRLLPGFGDNQRANGRDST